MPYLPGEESSLVSFLQNSEYKILSDESLYGVNLLATSSTLPSPFFPVNIREYNLNTPVQHVMIKISFITDNDVETYFKYRFKKYKYAVPRNDFEKEIQMQRNIFNRTVGTDELFLEGLVPCVLGYDYILPHESSTVFDYFSQGIDDGDKRKVDFLNFLDNFRKSHTKVNALGFLFMESFDDVSTAYSLVSSPPTLTSEDILRMAQTELRLLHNYDYIHCDFHQSNILYFDAPGYYGTPGVSKRAMIIDFGRTIQFPNTVWKKEFTEFMDSNSNEFKHSSVDPTMAKIIAKERIFNPVNIDWDEPNWVLPKVSQPNLYMDGRQQQASQYKQRVMQLFTDHNVFKQQLEQILNQGKDSRDIVKLFTSTSLSSPSSLVEPDPDPVPIIVSDPISNNQPYITMVSDTIDLSFSFPSHSQPLQIGRAHV